MSSTGVEVQQIVTAFDIDGIDSERMSASDYEKLLQVAVSNRTTYFLTLMIGGKLAETKDCLPLDATASQMQDAINSMVIYERAPGTPGANEMPWFERSAHEQNAEEKRFTTNQTVVTRTGAGTLGNSYVYSIYFEGDEVLGDVADFSVDPVRR